MTITQEPDLPDLVRMIVDRMRSNGIDYEDGGIAETVIDVDCKPQEVLTPELGEEGEWIDT